MWSFTIFWPSLDVPCRKKSLNIVFRFSLVWNCHFSENFLFHPWFPPSDCASYWTAVEKQKQMPLWSFQWRGTDAYERDLKGGRGDSSMCTFSSILIFLGQRKACHARTVQVKYTRTHTQGPPCPCPLSPSFSVNNHCRRALVAMQQHKGRCRRGQRNRSRRLLSQRNASQAAIYILFQHCTWNAMCCLFTNWNARSYDQMLQEAFLRQASLHCASWYQRRSMHVNFKY